MGWKAFNRAVLAALLGLALPFAATGAARAADDLRLDGVIIQGGLLRGQVAPGTGVSLDGRAIRVAPDGRFVFGFGRDAGPAAVLALTPHGGTRQEQALAIVARTYDIQRIDKLPEKMVNPDPEALARIKRDNARVGAARRVDSDETGHRQGFIWPAEGRITGLYGSQRILNGEPRQPHFGIDVAGPAGSPILAAADGVVTLAGDLYFTGGTIIIDHGFGISTTSSHLDRIAVKEGQRVRQGEAIGTMGKSGRVTGVHLDWRINWYEVRLDPLLVLPPRAGDPPRADGVK